MANDYGDVPVTSDNSQTDPEQLAMAIRAFQSQQPPTMAPAYQPGQDVSATGNSDTPNVYQDAPQSLRNGRGGIIKRLLTNFTYSGGQAMMHAAGLPTDSELAMRQAQMQQMGAQTVLGLAHAQQVQAQTKMMGNLVTVQTPMGLMQLPAALATKILQAQTTGQSRENVANIGATSREKVANINQGQGVPVNETIANLVGMPEIAGQPGGKALWNNINASLRANGYQYKDLGNEGMWLMDRAGNKIQRVSDSPGLAMANARGQAFAQARAQWSPFQTFDEQGNLTTTSAANAIQSGAPSASTWQSLYGPTSSTKTAGQAAGAVTSHIPDLRQQVATLGARGDLGPVMGRMNEWMNSGYGGNDPLIANFVANMKLMNSGTVRAHFGARGGAQVLDQFNRILNTSQDPGAINGALNGIESWLNKYGDIGRAQGPRTNIPGPVKRGIKSGKDPLGIR